MPAETPTELPGASQTQASHDGSVLSTSVPAASRRRTLANGLTVLSREVHDAPVATFWVWYRVGGRNEVAGITGISHWVEHMLFKGTPTFGKGSTAREVTKNGGTFNGFTWIDYTAFFETLPSDRIDLALRIESDRMVNSVFEPDEVASERTVILSEREGNENYPTFHLGEEVAASAFKVHPYGQESSAGSATSRRCHPRGPLRRYKRTTRRTTPSPSPATSARRDAEADRGAVRRDSGRRRRTTTARWTSRRGSGERRVEVQRPGARPPTRDRLSSACRHRARITSRWSSSIPSLAAPSRSHRRWGGGAGNRSSRLYTRAGRNRAGGVRLLQYRPRRSDPYLLSFSATVREGQTPAAVKGAIFAEIDRMQQEPVSENELAKALKQRAVGLLQ